MSPSAMHCNTGSSVPVPRLSSVYRGQDYESVCRPGDGDYWYCGPERGRDWYDIHPYSVTDFS